MVVQCEHACLGLAWFFFAAAASLALIGSGSLQGIGEFWIMERKTKNVELFVEFPQENCSSDKGKYTIRQ